MSEIGIGTFQCEICGQKHIHNYSGYRSNDYTVKIEVIPHHQGWCHPCPSCLKNLLNHVISILDSLEKEWQQHEHQTNTGRQTSSTSGDNS